MVDGMMLPHAQGELNHDLAWNHHCTRSHFCLFALSAASDLWSAIRNLIDEAVPDFATAADSSIAIDANLQKYPLC